MSSGTDNGNSGDSNTTAEISVVIAASGCADAGANVITPRAVHAISVTQQSRTQTQESTQTESASWTVLREYADFSELGNALSSIVTGLPQCPPLIAIKSVDDVSNITASRTSLQEWLTTILLFPGVKESLSISPALRHFLCHDANVVPPQYGNLAWVSFAPQITQQQQQHESAPQCSPNQYSNNGMNYNDRNLSIDEMEMDEMFPDHCDDDVDDNVEDYDDDDDTYGYNASTRYQPTDEHVTLEEAMEIQQEADEVEMIEDVGSLAQSLGASHLGRSLQLQAQHMNQRQKSTTKPAVSSSGVNINTNNIRSSKNSATSGGGIGQAVNSAPAPNNANIEGLGDSFHQCRTISAPRLDSFKMIKVVGKGSFGKVFLVREIKTGEMFALKVLRKDNIIKRNQVEHTRTERSVLGYVKHPFIVGLNMAFQSKDKLYFVLDYCAGGELFFHLGKLGKFPEQRARFYAAEIILAISYVHELDIIYRDLKPENVLLDARGHVRLTDFGLSKEGISNSSSGAYSFCGTPEYLAPEILNRQGHGRAVDWWSLGALLYEMLTGLPPFYCRDREKLFEKIRRSELAYPRSLSSCAVSLLRGLLTRDPRRRLGSGPTDAEEIKTHPFFADTNWEKLAAGEIPPPWDPQISGSLDTSQFDKEFTSMPIFSPQSFQTKGGFSGMTSQDNVFEGFTFTDRNFYHPGEAGN